MEKARVYFYENGERFPYLVDHLDREGQVVKRPLELVRADYENLMEAQPRLFDPDNPNRVELVCKCCGKKLEPDMGFRLFDMEANPRSGRTARSKPGFIHAEEDDRDACPSALARDPRFKDYFCDDSFDIFEKERREKNLGNIEIGPIDNLLLGLVGADAYPQVKDVYRLMLSGRWTPQRNRNARHYKGIGVQKLPFFSDGEKRCLLVPLKLQLCFSDSGNPVIVQNKPVEWDFSDSFQTRTMGSHKEPDEFTGLGDGRAHGPKTFIGAKLGA